jgi:hypothetical protein
MKILAQSGEFVNRKGIYPPLPGAEKIEYVQMEVLSSRRLKTRKRSSARSSYGETLPIIFLNSKAIGFALPRRLSFLFERFELVLIAYSFLGII